ncbi:MAG TPA: Uma2 family endonuclease [Solirubrobacteraceae bacterium]|nr:Uma2 family endonuclease [Solirubrobacteraceae bacterium]
MAVDISEFHRLTSDEYHLMIESGGFDEETHIELIDGILCDMSPKTPEHGLVVEYLNRVLAAALDHDRFRLRVTGSLSLGDSEPEPDLAIVARGTPDPYHPASAELVIEVAISSRRRDLAVKPPLYARAGVTEYWVIDVAQNAVVVHRAPGKDGYGSRVELRPGEALDGGVVGVGELDVASVLGAAAG